VKYNSFEEELDAIRIAIYEKTKDMTPGEEIAYLRAQTDPIHEQYGIRRAKSAAEKGKIITA
jgi:hypothetical protein